MAFDDDHIFNDSRVLTMTTDPKQNRQDIARIREGRKVQRALWHDSNGSTDMGKAGYLSRSPTSRLRSVLHRLSNKHVRIEHDTNTIPVLTRRAEKKERKKVEKIEKIKLQESIATQQRVFTDSISRVKHLDERVPPSTAPSSPSRNVKKYVKGLVSKKKRSTVPTIESLRTPLNPAAPLLSPPHIYDFKNESQFQTYLNTGRITAPETQLHTNFSKQPPAELAAVSGPVDDLYGSESKRSLDVDHNHAYSTAPPTFRSLASSPVQYLAIDELVQPVLQKQMRCDICHIALSLDEYHYACDTCVDGPRLYCSKCLACGETCRHEPLIEKIRDIKRHPTNARYPSTASTHVLTTNADSTAADQSCLHQSDTLPTSAPSLPMAQPFHLETAGPSTPVKDKVTTPLIPPTLVTPSSEHSATELLRDLKHQKREQELSFREQMCQLKDQQTSALYQQMQATIMLQQERSALGAQFTPISSVSRHSSRCSTAYGSILRRHTDCPCMLPAIQREQSDLCSHSCSLPDPRLVSALEFMEASATGIITHTPRQSSQKGRPAQTSTSPSSTTSKHKGKSKSTSYSLKRSQDDDLSDVRSDSERSEGGGGSPNTEAGDTSRAARVFLACPFCKHDPMRYSEKNKDDELYYRGCASLIAGTISRIKQHIKRNHHRPEFHCSRCYAEFSNDDDLRDHEASHCEPQPCPWPERLNERQQLWIHRKRPKMDTKTEWNLIYNIIFPGQPLPPNPYIEQVTQMDDEQQRICQSLDNLRDRLRESAGDRAWLAPKENQEFVVEMVRNMLSNLMCAPVSPASQRSSCKTSLGASRAVHKSFQFDDAAGLSQDRPRKKPRTPRTPVAIGLSVTDHGEGLKAPVAGLKITTTFPGNTPPGTSASHESSMARRLEFAARSIPEHVSEDVARSGAESSWQHNDDQRVTRRHKSGAPPSATSSPKSVSFATKDEHVSVPTNASLSVRQEASWDDTATAFSKAERQYAPQQCSSKMKDTDSGYGTLTSHGSVLDRKQQGLPGLHDSFSFMHANVPASGSMPESSLAVSAQHTQHPVNSTGPRRPNFDDVSMFDWHHAPAYEQAVTELSMASQTLLPFNYVTHGYGPPGFVSNNAPACHSNMYSNSVFPHSCVTTVNPRQLDLRPQQQTQAFQYYMDDSMTATDPAEGTFSSSGLS